METFADKSRTSYFVYGDFFDGLCTFDEFRAPCHRTRRENGRGAAVVRGRPASRGFGTVACILHKDRVGVPAKS